MSVYGDFPTGPFFTAGITKDNSFSYSVDSEGKATVQLTKTFDDTSVTVPFLNQEVPGATNCLVSGFTKKQVSGGFWEVSLNGRGIDVSTPTASLFTFDLINAVADEPIQTHKDFKSMIVSAGLSVIEGTTRGTTGSIITAGVIFANASNSTTASEAITGDFVCFTKDASAGLAGVQSYLRPQMVYRISYLQDSKPSTIATVGTRVTPSGAPTLPAGANWLFSALNYRQIGRSGSYEVTEEYRASGPEGWNTLIYD
jgi:hypothetical protein